MAVDGTKVAAKRPHHATRSYEQIAREILEEAARSTRPRTSCFGDARGDELPEGLRTSGDRREVLREAKRALEAERAAQAKKIARDRGERRLRCRRRLREDWELERPRQRATPPGTRPDRQRRLAADGGARPTQALPATRSRRARSTSPILTRATSRGHTDGCRATTPRPSSTKTKSCSPPRSASTSPDTAHLEPMVETAIRELEAIGVTDTPGVVLADAGYWKTSDRDARLGGHPDARPAGRRPAQGTPARRRGGLLRLHPPRPRDRPGQGALPPDAKGSSSPCSAR